MNQLARIRKAKKVIFLIIVLLLTPLSIVVLNMITHQSTEFTLADRLLFLILLITIIVGLVFTIFERRQGEPSESIEQIPETPEQENEPELTNLYLTSDEALEQQEVMRPLPSGVGLIILFLVLEIVATIGSSIYYLIYLITVKTSNISVIELLPSLIPTYAPTIYLWYLHLWSFNYVYIYFLATILDQTIVVPSIFLYLMISVIKCVLLIFLLRGLFGLTNWSYKGTIAYFLITLALTPISLLIGNEILLALPQTNLYLAVKLFTPLIGNNIATIWGAIWIMQIFLTLAVVLFLRGDVKYEFEKRKPIFVKPQIPKKPQCANCGSQTPINAKFCPQCGSMINRCSVCNRSIILGDLTAECPYCGAQSHRDHLLEWIKVKGHCPHCNKKLSKKDIPKNP